MFKLNSNERVSPKIHPNYYFPKFKLTVDVLFSSLTTVSAIAFIMNEALT